MGIVNAMPVGSSTVPLVSVVLVSGVVCSVLASVTMVGVGVVLASIVFSLLSVLDSVELSSETAVLATGCPVSFNGW